MKGKLLLAARDHTPAFRRFLRELSGDWEVHLGWTGPDADQLLANLKTFISKNDYAAVLLTDHPSSRACLNPLKAFTSRPIVLVQLKNPVPDLTPADETWAFSGNRRMDRAWINQRLSKLSAPAKPGKKKLASIIIPCFNNLRYTRECIEHLTRNTKTPYELIVVDNGSTDGTAAYVKKNTKARLIENRDNLGFAKAINQGMRAARGEFMVWLNNDVIVTPGWLEGLIACAERSPRIGAVGPCTNETVGYQKVARAPYRGDKELYRFAQAWSLKNGGRAIAAHRLVGFCLLLKREAVKQVGLLDKRFGLGCYEDYDYCLRLRQAGYDLTCALDVFVHHHGHKSFKNDKAMLSQAARNRDLFLEKWCHQTLQFLDELDPEAAKAQSDLLRHGR